MRLSRKMVTLFDVFTENIVVLDGDLKGNYQRWYSNIKSYE